MTRHTPTKTWALFTVEDKRDPRSWSLKAVEVDTRDIHAVEKPKGAFRCYFFDAPADSRDIMEDAVNASPSYVFAEKTVPAAEAHALAMRRKEFREKFANDKFFAAVWTVRAEKEKLFAVTKHHRFVAVGRTDTVLNSKGEQIYPRHARRKKLSPAEALEKAVQRHTVLARDITIHPPVRIKPRKFGP